MPFTLRIREIGFVADGPSQHELSAIPSAPSKWDVEVTAGSESVPFRLSDPSGASPMLLGKDPEAMITWYLEQHADEPFETTKAGMAAELLSAYGRHLALQVVQSGLLPKTGDVQLQIASSVTCRQQTDRAAEKAPESLGQALQLLHWEVLEDAEVWPAGYRFGSISVVRLVTVPSVKGHAVDSPRTEGSTFNILLVVSRPRPQKDVDYQLVAKYLVANVDYFCKTRTRPNIKASLKILRPPTWQAFQEDLRDNRYDLVHFDMKGEIWTSPNGNTSAVLEFCKPSLSEPLKIKRDLRTGDEVGSELARAGVRTVVLNACNSASFRGSAPGSNLAEVLLSHGVHCVVAMAYRVVEEAVEIFMAAFYQSLLARGASVHDATHVARAALLRNQSRRARYMHNVQLADYIVPVHYASSSHLDPPGINDVVGTGEAGVSSYVQRIFASLKQITPSGPAAGGPLRKDMPPGFLGRDYNILSLEMLLSVSRLVLVHGQGGVGKTELLRSAFQWWKTSGWITAAVYVNLDHGKGLYSMKDIVAKIAEQLGLAPEKEDIEDVVIKNLRRRKCLLVFDSAETLDSSIQLDKVIWSPDLAERLRRFIDAAISDSESKVIVSSRLETTAVANIPSERHVYPLLGLSVLDSTTLLQNPSVGPGEELPEGFSRRENIDGLRRVAILLEGNPLALELVAPELKRVKYNGETLFHNLLYGVCKTHVDGNELNRGRFIRSLHIALKDPSFLDSHATLIEACQFAPFWTLMPKDLAPYYWFFHLASSKYSQGSYATWISEEFRDTVKRSTMAQRLRVHWANIEARLIEAGILCHATITRKDGKEIRCYHVHPIYTLVSRSFLTDETWKAARFAFVRQALLWHPEDDDNALQWAKIEWGGAGPQHDDHLHNWRAMAVGWSVYDGNPQEEVERMGVTMMDCTYRLSIGAVWKNPRQARLLIPHVRAYLTQIYQTAGAILSASSLQAIIDYSLTLWRLEPDGVGQSAQSDVVKRALAAVERWRAARPPGLAILPPAEEVMWFQLRHVEATMVEQTGHLAQAKAMHQRNLETDPMATIPALCNIIRRSHLRSLTAWANCVTTLATQEGALSKTAIMSTAREFTSSFGDKRACEMMGAMAQVMAGHKAAMKSVRVRDTIGFALEREPAAVARFGALATSTIDMPLFDVFADHVQGEVVEYMADLFAAAQRSVDAESAALRAQIRAEESGLHLLAGDTAAAAKTVQAEMAREALSSTTSTGWEKLADLHMYMHMLVVMRAEKPDYGKGLMHLQEWWRLHRGAGMPKKDVAFGFMKIATCYSGLGRLADAARAIIKVAGVLRALEPSDCIDGDVVGEREWILERIAGYEELQVFLSPMIVFSTSSEVAELSLKERLTMHRIMTKAKKTEKAKKEADQMFLQVEAMLEQVKLLRETGV